MLYLLHVFCAANIAVSWKQIVGGRSTWIKSLGSLFTEAVCYSFHFFADAAPPCLSISHPILSSLTRVCYHETWSTLSCPPFLKKTKKKTKNSDHKAVVGDLVGRGPNPDIPCSTSPLYWVLLCRSFPHHLIHWSTESTAPFFTCNAP